MGFLGISGKRWKQIGKIALKVAPIAAAPFTGGASLLALGVGTGAVSGALGGGGWKGALMGGAMGAIPGGGAGGAVAGGAAKAGLKEIAKSIGKGAATNFVTGVGTGLATGQGVKGALKAGQDSAVSGVGSAGPSGSFGQVAKTIGKNVAKNTALSLGGQAASQGLQKAGVPGGLAAQGGNVFTNYLGNKFTGPQPGGSNFVSPGQGQAPAGNVVQGTGLTNYLPPQAQAPAAAPGSPSWKSLLTGAVSGGLSSALNGGGAKGFASGAVQGAGGAVAPGGGQSQPTYPGGSPTTGLGQQAGGPPVGDQPSGPYQPAGGPMTFPQQQQQQPQKPPPDPNRPATWAERYGPLIAQGAGVAIGGLVGQQAQKNAMKRSPEEQAALTGAQGAADQTGQLGGQLARQGQDYLQGPGAYFQTLLGGNRAAMAQATAGPAAQITGNYRGAERALDQQGVRGAGRDQAVMDLNRQRASQIAGLTTGMQPYAAEQLASMGNSAVGQGLGALGTSGSLYGNLLTQGSANRQYARKEGADTAKAIGGLARDVGEVAFKRPQAPATPSTADKKSQGGTAQAPPPQTQGGPAPTQAPPPGGTVQAPPPSAGPGQLPFQTPGNLGIDFRTGVRKPAPVGLGGDFRTY